MIDKGPFKYYVIKEVGGWGQKMAIFDDLCVKNPYGKLSIVMKCPYKFDESENVHRVK